MSGEVKRSIDAAMQSARYKARRLIAQEKKRGKGIPPNILTRLTHTSR